MESFSETGSFLLDDGEMRLDKLLVNVSMVMEMGKHLDGKDYRERRVMLFK